MAPLRSPLPALLVQIISNSGAHISQFLLNAIQSIVGAQMIGSLRNVNIQSDDIYACFTKSTNKVIEGKPWKTFYLSPKKDRTMFTDFDSSHRNWDKYFFAVGGAWYPEYVPQEIFPLARVFIKGESCFSLILMCINCIWMIVEYLNSLYCCFSFSYQIFLGLRSA